MQHETTKTDIKIQGTSGAGTPKRGNFGRIKPQIRGDRVRNQHVERRLHPERDGRLQAQAEDSKLSRAERKIGQLELEFSSKNPIFADSISVTMKKIVCLFCFLVSFTLGELLAQPVQEPPEIQRIMKKQAILETRLSRQSKRWENRQVKQGNLVIDYFVYDEPVFLEGGPCLNCFLSSFIHYPDSAKRAGICGTVIVNFCVEKDGTVEIAEAKQKVHPMLDAEAVRGVKSTSGMWKPAREFEKKKRHWFNVPVRFQCSNDTDSILSKRICDCSMSSWGGYTFQSPFQSSDTILLPLRFNSTLTALSDSDSTAFIRVLKQLGPDEDIIVHIYTYRGWGFPNRDYYYPPEYLNRMVQQYAPRAAMVVTHYAGFGEIKGNCKYEKRYLKVLNQYPYVTYAVIVKI